MHGNHPGYEQDPPLRKEAIIMSIRNQLSSQTGDHTETSNLKVVAKCLENPDLLAEIAAGLKDRDAALVGDCAEVLTEVAEVHPELVVPYADALSALLAHRTTRVRWEAMHALALVASSTPTTIAPMLLILMEKIRTDPSVIVRDYATDAITNYASTSKYAAECAYHLLIATLTLWAGKHAGHALVGLAHIARLVPARGVELRGIAEEYFHSERAVVRKAAKGLLKAIDSHSQTTG
jgi:hypothetical protein